MTNVVHLNQNIIESSVPYRLMIALDKLGIRSDIVTMISKVDNERVHVIKLPLVYRIKRKGYIFFTKLLLGCYPKRDKRFPFSFSGLGINLKNNSWYQNADVVIIHWIWGCFLSVKDIEEILKSGKKVIVVCHDNAHFTGGCHVRMGC